MGNEDYATKQTPASTEPKRISRRDLLTTTAQIRGARASPSAPLPVAPSPQT